MRRAVAVVAAAACLTAACAPAAQARKVKPLRPHGQWVRLTDAVADAVAEGVDDPMSIPDSHDGCLMRVTRTWQVTIVCPDGRRFRS